MSAERGGQPMKLNADNLWQIVLAVISIALAGTFVWLMLSDPCRDTLLGSGVWQCPAGAHIARDGDAWVCRCSGVRIQWTNAVDAGGEASR